MFRHKDLFGTSFRFGLSFRCLDRFFGLVSITISSIRLALGVELLGIPAIHVVDLFETLIVCFRNFIKARDFVFSVGSKIWKRIKKSICSQYIPPPPYIGPDLHLNASRSTAPGPAKANTCHQLDLWYSVFLD